MQSCCEACHQKPGNESHLININLKKLQLCGLIFGGFMQIIAQPPHTHSSLLLLLLLKFCPELHLIAL